MKIPEQLALIVDTEFTVAGFAFDQDRRLSIMKNRIVDLFPFFDSEVGGEFRDDLFRIENVISEKLDEGHHERIFGRFFRFDSIERLLDAFRNFLERVFHGNFPFPRQGDFHMQNYSSIFRRSQAMNA